MLTAFVKTQVLSAVNFLLAKMNQDKVWLEGATYHVGATVYGRLNQDHHKYICKQVANGLCSETTPGDQDSQVWEISDFASDGSHQELSHDDWPVD